MNICVVSHSFFPATCYGGPIFSTYELCKKLTDLGFNIYVSTTNANSRNRLDVVTNKFIEIHKNLHVCYYFEQIYWYFSFALIFGLWKDIKRSELIYIQYIFHYTVPLALFYSWILNKRVVICPRASLSPWGINWKGKISNLFKRSWISLFIRPFVSNVKWQGCSFIEIKDIKSFFYKADCYELSDGINTSLFSSERSLNYIDVIKKYTDRDFDRVTDIVFSMGRLHKIKGFDNLIRSFSLVLKSKPDVKLLIAGSDDNYKSFLLQEIKRLELLDSVFLIGHLDDIEKREVLSNSSVFTLCSHVESFGIVVLEALASGLPVVVSNKTIWKDLERNKCGIFVSNQESVFAEALLSALDTDYNPSDCVNYVKFKYDIDIVCNNFIKYFCRY
ncbi:MAG: glycosyltransferase [Flavobacteriales bacterium]|jgi:glycosyltransferase involved in cell wall biosynthesis|nr:glycosyltransferase [Flavobacteriales bacterium]